jgi:hypothetical protein
MDFWGAQGGKDMGLWSESERGDSMGRSSFADCLRSCAVTRGQGTLRQGEEQSGVLVPAPGRPGCSTLHQGALWGTKAKQAERREPAMDKR